MKEEDEEGIAIEGGGRAVGALAGGKEDKIQNQSGVEVGKNVVAMATVLHDRDVTPSTGALAEATETELDRSK